MHEEKVKILYVDDEVNNLTSFKAAFRRQYDVYTAISAEDGIKILEANKDIQVIITDQRMPQVTGVEFLQSVIKKYPEPIRILLTGHADIAVVVNAINKGQIFQYIEKPWNENELRETLKTAHEAYALKKQKENESNNFLYKVSHDLKGPLASLAGLVNMAKKETNLDHMYQYVEYIGKSVLHLDDILNELLMLLRVEKADLNMSLINFNDLVQEVISSLEHIENVKVEFKVQISQDNEFVNDKVIIRSIIQNLVQNAIKYRRTDIPDPFVEMIVSSTDQKAEIEIKDNGIGIGQEAVPNIFKIFYRANETIKGSGLGLYIVKTGVEKIGGEISVKSTVNEGTVFAIRIPNRQLL